MRAFAAVAATIVGLAAGAMVSEAQIRDNDGIQSVILSIDGNRCSATAAAVTARELQCGHTGYTWHVAGAKGDYEVILYIRFMGTQPGAPRASSRIPVDCRPTEDPVGPNDWTCYQIQDLPIDI